MAAHKKPFVCECGEPAVKRNSNREPICAECDRLARITSYTGGYLAAQRPRKPELSTAVDGPEECSIVSSAMERLESMLKAVDNPA
jgi:hypothetical protein